MGPPAKIFILVAYRLELSGIITIGQISLCQMIQQSKKYIVQPIWCEVCNIECNSPDVLEKYVLAKNHQIHLQSKNSLTAATLPKTFSTPNNISLRMGGIGEQRMSRANGVGGQDLDLKWQKLLSGGVVSEVVRVCSIYSVACNS